MVANLKTSSKYTTLDILKRKYFEINGMTSKFLPRTLPTKFYKNMTRKSNFLRVPLGSSSWYYAGLEILHRMVKWFKLGVTQFWKIIATFVKITWKKLVGSFFASPNFEYG